MNKRKDSFIVGLALFSMFFGAGNLILPPYLGLKSGIDWPIVAIGFTITAVVIPILGILAHARLQGTMYDFGKKVSSTFSWVFCFLVYAISITLPAPRTASVTHEMAIEPFFGTSSLLTSSIYFVLVFIFVINRSKILNIIGKYLTPLIVLILLIIICLGFFTTPQAMHPSTFKTPLIGGLIEGYQTFDAIGSIVVGGVIIVSLNLKEGISYDHKKILVRNGGIIAGTGLLLIYSGLIVNGALYNSIFSEEATRTEVLSSLSSEILGNIGASFLSVLVALACFTTAIGIIVGTADYFKGLFKESKVVYILTAIIACVLGIIMGQFDVHYIINIALPILMFIYPITIALILLNVIPEKFASKTVFKAVIFTTFLFSIPDFLKFIIPKDNLLFVQYFIPFSQYSLGWVLPALLVFVTINLINSRLHFK